tara:strand:- start:4729 stop:5424 length:696 start_codon:yes stop_codon:yes gene_type:complete
MIPTILRKHKNKIFLLSIIIIIFVIIYFTLFTTKTNKDEKNTVEKNKISQSLFYPKEKTAKESHRISQNYIKQPSNNQMSLSVKIKVHNWYHNFDHWKHILHKGTEITSSTNKKYNTLRLQSPGIWFHPKVNNMRFVLSVYNDFTFKHKYCDIKNIPIGRYFHIVFTTEDTNISIFIDGRLVKTCVFQGIPILTEGDIFVNYGITYDGSIKHLQFFDKVLSIDEIKSLSKK